MIFTISFDQAYLVTMAVLLHHSLTCIYIIRICASPCIHPPCIGYSIRYIASFSTDILHRFPPRVHPSTTPAGTGDGLCAPRANGYWSRCRRRRLDTRWHRKYRYDCTNAVSAPVHASRQVHTKAKGPRPPATTWPILHQVSIGPAPRPFAVRIPCPWAPWPFLWFPTSDRG